MTQFYDSDTSDGHKIGELVHEYNLVPINKKLFDEMLYSVLRMGAYNGASTFIRN